MFIFVFHVLRSEKVRHVQQFGFLKGLILHTILLLQVWQSSCVKYLRDKASSTFKSASVTGTTMTKKSPSSYAMVTSSLNALLKIILFLLNRSVVVLSVRFFLFS